MKPLKSARRVLLSLLSENVRFIINSPPGHYYSPIPDLSELQRRKTEIFNNEVHHIPAVSLSRERQLKLINKFSEYYSQLSLSRLPTPAARYYYENSVFCVGDAVVLYCFMRHLRPQLIVEIGSGFSSAVMLDIREKFLNENLRMIFVEPNTKRLRSLIKQSDVSYCEIYERKVQDVDINAFKNLQRNDILFIDSSHTVKCASDLNHLVFEVLPVLNEGVYVHFHDVFWPFEYPYSWFKKGRAWNEVYLLRAFLQYNKNFNIQMFNSYLSKTAPEEIERCMPLVMENPGGSLWLKVSNT